VVDQQEANMISHDDVPYADSEPLVELIRECGCLEDECTSHGVALHHEYHPAGHPHPAPLAITEATRHVLDGYPGYGS
jgi:hypothetical protein